MTERDPRGVLTIAGRLLHFPEPVSFLDAVMLVRHARKTGEPREEELRALITLHDAPHTTDGARDVLRDFLGGWAKRQARQRTLGARVLTARDTGKTARVTAGTTLVIELGERRGKGCRWEVLACEGPGECVRDPSSEVSPSRATYLLHCQRPGQIHLTLAERSGAGAPPPASEDLILTVVVEAPSGEPQE